MRQEIVPPPDLTDPLAVLDEIVGKSFRGTDSNGVEAVSLDKSAEHVEDIDFAGLSLQDFAAVEDTAPENQPGSILSIEECEYVYPSHCAQNLRLMSRR